MLRLFNTLTREKQEFKPLNPKEVTFYSCGPTVYNYAHIGNLRTYIFNDILKRTLLYNKFKVKHVMNITDVGHLTDDSDTGEDKIEKAAELEGRKATEIADFYTRVFKNNLKSLNILDPNIWAKATSHIQEQIDLIKVLESKGYTYKISDGIYFDTSKSKDYGKLARLNLAGQEEGTRIEINQEKKNPHDFALWKFSPQDQQRQMEWDSPWGVGFPGWHVECSAMSMKYLGEVIDIHTGGIDHIPVHHTNEIAQSKAAIGKDFVRYWVHGDFLVFNKAKMAKSKGNFITLQVLEKKGFEPVVYRYFCLGAIYRSKLNFTLEALDNTKNIWQKFQEKFLNLGKVSGKVDRRFKMEFKEYINDDLNTPKALALVWQVFKLDLSDADKRATILDFDKVLGLGLESLKFEKVEIPSEIKLLADKRFEYKLAKKFDKADALRDELKDLGWEIYDELDSYRLEKGR